MDGVGLNCPAAAPNAADNTHSKLLLEGMGKPTKLPWSWWALDRTTRYEGRKAVGK